MTGSPNGPLSPRAPETSGGETPQDGDRPAPPGRQRSLVRQLSKKLLAGVAAVMPNAHRRFSFGTMAAIRGTSGFTLETEVQIRRGSAGGGGCCGGGSAKSRRACLVVKGAHAFIFYLGAGETASDSAYCSYAIPLGGVHAEVLSECDPLVVALVRNEQQAYVLTFEDSGSGMSAYDTAVKVTKAFESGSFSSFANRAADSGGFGRMKHDRSESILRAIDMAESSAEERAAVLNSDLKS
jgi:hypothetical protein